MRDNRRSWVRFCVVLVHEMISQLRVRKTPAEEKKSGTSGGDGVPRPSDLQGALFESPTERKRSFHARFPQLTRMKYFTSLLKSVTVLNEENLTLKSNLMHKCYE